MESNRVDPSYRAVHQSEPGNVLEDSKLASRELINGRLRRKARMIREPSKHQEEKRRAYFCCISKCIDIQSLFEYLEQDFFAKSTWIFYIVGDALILQRTSQEDSSTSSGKKSRNNSSKSPKFPVVDENDFEKSSWNFRLDLPSPLTQEIYIFNFGVSVFWGFSKGEETSLLNIIRRYSTGASYSGREFEEGEDDIDFVISFSAIVSSLADNCVYFPDKTNLKQRLAISYAIAQSSILSVMETCVESKMDEYEYMPTTLARGKSVNMSVMSLRKKIGEIMIVRHEVNLHSDLLDIPDFFWTEEKYTTEYDIARRYLEMTGRIEVVNRRLELLKQLLDVINLQLVNSHSKYRTEILIYLIALYVLIEIGDLVLPRIFGSHS